MEFQVWRRRYSTDYTVSFVRNHPESFLYPSSSHVIRLELEGINIPPAKAFVTMWNQQLVRSLWFQHNPLIKMAKNRQRHTSLITISIRTVITQQLLGKSLPVDAADRVIQVIQNQFSHHNLNSRFSWSQTQHCRVWHVPIPKFWCPISSPMISMMIVKDLVG